MLRIWVLLSGRAAMHLHSDLARRAASPAHEGTACLETWDACFTRPAFPERPFSL